MDRITHDNLVYYQFSQFRYIDEIVHGVFSRRGGISPPPFDSLNVGSTVGDAWENVAANRAQMAGALGLNGGGMRTTWQVHGADVIVARRDDPPADPPPQADGIVTSEVGLPLVMRFADCVPILFYDPRQRAIGMAHAGWRGTLAGIGPATVRRMVEAFGTRPEDLIAGIGPAIGPCCYEVGAEVVARFRDEFPYASDLVWRPLNGHDGPHLDLWTANRRALEEAGVGQIEVSALCTACHVHEFFSHRAEAGRTGRFGAVLALRGPAES